MKYKILFDYRTEGFKFDDEEFENIDDAVKQALARNNCTPFLIVQVVDWQAEPKTA